MSGWNDEDRLAEARALHSDFTGRSPGSRRRGANSSGAALGRGRGRGHGNISPSPAHDPSNSGNDNMTPAGQNRSGHPALLSGGRGGFGSNKTARVGGSGGRNQSAAPLATSDQFFAHFNKNHTNAPAGSSAAASGARGVHSTPTTRDVIAKNASNSGEPMVLDQPAESSNVTGHNARGISSAFPRSTQKDHMSTDISGGPMDLDNSKDIQSTAALAKPKSPKRGLMSSKWCTDPDASATSTGRQGPTNDIATQPNTVVSTDNIGTHVENDKRARSSKNARFSDNTKPGLAASRWAKPPSPPKPVPSELSPVYRSDNWIKDLREENAAGVMHQTDHPPGKPLGQRNDHLRSLNKESAMRTFAAPSAEALAKTRVGTQPSQPAAPANALSMTAQDAKKAPALPVSRPAPASNVTMKGQAPAESPAAYQFGTQPSGRHDIGFNQPSVGAVYPAVDRGSTYQPSSAGLPRQGQPQQAQVAATSPAIGADGSLNLQPLQHQVSGVNTSSAGPRAEYTAQHVQQGAQPTSDNVGQKSTQPVQRSADPFDDPDFKDFWENNYMRKNN